MRVEFRTGWFTGLVLTLTIGLYCVWLWQPQRQIDRHAKNLLHDIEQRNWTVGRPPAISPMLAGIRFWPIELRARFDYKAGSRAVSRLDNNGRESFSWRRCREDRPESAAC